MLDTIYKCGVTSVSQSLWELLVQECERHYYLSNITQKRYDYYRSYLPGLALFKFDYKGEKKQDNVEYVAALPTIPKSEFDQTPIDGDSMSRLYNILYRLGKIDCPFECFNSAFSGITKITLPIKWLTLQKDLASFLFVLRAEGHGNEAYASHAAKVFIKKNGRPCSASTLNQWNDEMVKSYKNIFKEVGITRNKFEL